MPQTLSAKRALRKDRRRSAVNLLVDKAVRQALNLARKKPTLKTISEASRILDQAAKKRVIHERKADRLKSRLAKLLKITNPRKQVSPNKKTKKIKNRTGK